MISFRSIKVPLVALMLVMAGCSAESGTPASNGSVDGIQQAAAADLVKTTSHGPGMQMDGRRGGPDFLVQAALRAPIGLSDAQRATIERLAKASKPAAPVFDKSRASALATAIRNNTVDSVPKPSFDESAHQARIAASAKALSTLHDTLTPEQRTKLIDSIENHSNADQQQKHEGREGRTAKRSGENVKRMGRGNREQERGMAMFAGLDLTQAQKDAIKAKLEAQHTEKPKPSAEQIEAMKAKFASIRTEMKSKLESFKGDSFDATAFVTQKAQWKPDTMKNERANRLAIITSVLTPAQRETLAQRIEQGPPAHVRVQATDAPVVK